MATDRYSRAMLTVIAVALVYICIVLTPWPTVSAQRGLRPGDDTGPAQAVIVGWRAGESVPVQIVGSVTLNTNGRISGPVQTEPAPGTIGRVVLAGWEEGGVGQTPGTFVSFGRDARPQGPPPGLPVTTVERR
jgi:hypothetical protein